MAETDFYSVLEEKEVRVSEILPNDKAHRRYGF